MIWAAALVLTSCLAPSGPNITAADLAPAVPAFRAVDPSTSLGYGPKPGAVRRFYAADLARLLPGASVSDLPESVCFEWPLKTPDPETFRQAMLSTLPEGSSLALIETSQFAVPPGTVRFPLTGLQSAIWRGYVEYSPGARFEVWARVDVQVPAQRVIATRDIAAGATLDETMVRAETVMGRPGPADLATSLDEVLGRPVRRMLRQGTAVPVSALDRRVDIRKGDVVRVRVSAGAASIGTDGVALASAVTGETIGVRVTETGRTVRARVAGPGETTLQLSGGN